MSYDPEKFSIGVIDLFSIFLPGAVLTYLVGDALGPRLLGEWYARLAGAEGWLVFLVAPWRT